MIYKAMSREQRSTCVVLFVPPPPPLPMVIPTEKQFTDFRDEKKYGVWIDEKKAGNTELDNYQAVDFAQVVVSRLFGAAKRNVKYEYQVDLMTRDYYADYYKKAIARKKYMMAVAMPDDSGIPPKPVR